MAEELNEIKDRIVEVGGRHFRIDLHGAKKALGLAAATAHLLNGPLRGLISNAGVFEHLEKYEAGKSVVVRDIIDSMNAAEISLAIQELANFILDDGEVYVDSMLEYTTLLSSPDGGGHETPCKSGGWDEVFKGRLKDLVVVLMEVAFRNFISSGGTASANLSQAGQALKKRVSSRQQGDSKKPTRSRLKG